MPNWVYNNLSASGTKEDIDALVARMAQPYEELNDEGEVYLCTPEDGFTFRNIISPPVDKLAEYHTTHGWSGSERTGDTEYNWYRWNNSMWGCKWDASDVDIERHDDTTVQYKFSTPWSSVHNLLVDELSVLFPFIVFNYDYEEEQGWGGEVQFQNGIIDMLHEWDIPDSHEAYEAIDRVGSCHCADGSSPEWWFADCPVDTDEYEWDGNAEEWKAKEVSNG